MAVVIRNINSNTSSSLGVNSFKKMYIANTSSSVEATVTIVLMQSGTGTVDSAHLLDSVKLPVGATIELDGWEQDSIYPDAGNWYDQQPIAATLRASAETGEYSIIMITNSTGTI